MLDTLLGMLDTPLKRSSRGTWYFWILDSPDSPVSPVSGGCFASFQSSEYAPEYLERSCFSKGISILVGVSIDLLPRFWDLLLTISTQHSQEYYAPKHFAMIHLRKWANLRSTIETWEELVRKFRVFLFIHLISLSFGWVSQFSFWERNCFGKWVGILVSDSTDSPRFFYIVILCTEAFRQDLSQQIDEHQEYA